MYCSVKELRRNNLRILARSLGGITPLAKRLNKSQSQISQLIGKNPLKNIGDRFAAEVEKTFDKPVGWLDIWDSETGKPYYKRIYYTVPLISWPEVLKKPPPVRTRSSPSKKRSKSIIIPSIFSTTLDKTSFALPVIDDSMEAPYGISFPYGSIIIVDPTCSPKSGNFILVGCYSNFSLVFKQLIIDGPLRYLKPLNTCYPITEMPHHATVHGVIRHMMMELK